MYEAIAIIIFIFLAFSIFAGGLHFSKYKRRKNAGCCGGVHCSTDGADSCYSAKEDFVDNFDKLKSDRMESGT